MDDLSNLEILWDKLLSKQKDLVQSAFTSLSLKEREAVIEHLKSMSSEHGWHSEQQKSAKAALTILEEYIE
jgi:hypothetical protein